MSSHPAQPDQLDNCTWTFNLIVISRKLYDIANTRGYAALCRKMVMSYHSVKPGRVVKIATVLSLPGFATKFFNAC